MENKLLKFINVIRYRKQLQWAGKNTGWEVVLDMKSESKEHPKSEEFIECEFAAKWINKLKPPKILDVGSYRQFLTGILAFQPITTIDVRNREGFLGERVVTCDAKKISFPDNTFDFVSCLCALEHFGLGRYKDEIDLEADRKAIKEMARVLEPDGHLLFGTRIRRKPTLYFNGGRVYDYKTIREMCSALRLVEEKFYSIQKNRFVSLNEVMNVPGKSRLKCSDIYLGIYQKIKL